MEILIRADDLGYCQAINYGIEKAAKCRLVRSVGLMPNMPAAPHGVELLAGTGTCLGLHTNISLGKPCTDSSKVPSLVAENGEFHSSRVYREAIQRGSEITELEEMILEVEAQYDRFVALTGIKPGYIECHAVQNKNLFQALSIIAERHTIPYNEMVQSGTIGRFNGKPVFNYPIYSVRPGEYDPWHCLRDAVVNARLDMPSVFVCHPGYIDSYLLKTSSLTINRAKEVEMLCDPAVKDWLVKEGVSLVSYDTIA